MTFPLIGTRVRASVEGVVSAHGHASFAVSSPKVVTWFRPDDPGLTVEVLPEPLPTEPGTRFWGRIGDAEPCWWMVQSRGRDERPAYIPSRVIDALAGVIFPEDYGLVRLPDPEATP